MIANVYPDLSLTPGVVAIADAKTVCRKGYTKDARHVTAKTKLQVFKRYGFVTGKFKPGDYEIDHLISLELGGANDIKNLWPQAYKGTWTAREKDVVETTLHRKICLGELDLKKAQEMIRSDWIKAYKQIKEARKK